MVFRLIKQCHGLEEVLLFLPGIKYQASLSKV